jgi:hypothetical protein
MEPVVYFPIDNLFCPKPAHESSHGSAAHDGVHLLTSLKSVAEARETAERRSRKLSLNRRTRARGGAFGPGSPMAMAARATRAGGFPEPDDTPISSAGDESDCPCATARRGVLVMARGRFSAAGSYPFRG